MVKDIFRFWNGNFLFLVAKASSPFSFSLKWANCPLTHWLPQTLLLYLFRIYLQETNTFLNISWISLELGEKSPWGGGRGLRGVAGDGRGSIELHGFLDKRASYFHSPLFVKWGEWDEMILQRWQTNGPWVEPSLQKCFVWLVWYFENPEILAFIGGKKGI